MLDPESQPVGVTLARNASGTQHPDRISQAPINPAAVRNTSPRRYMAERSSMRDLSARDAGEGNALMSYEDEEERLEDEEARIIGPSIMLQSPDSGASLRHCPSNNSLGTTTDNTESTRTRASLISQFPIHDRKPSDHSSRGGHEPGGAGGNAAGASGSRPAERKDGYHSGSGKSGSDSGMFSSPPPRPPSRTRTVPGQTPSTSIGLGRPPGSPAGPREPRLASLPERPTHSPYMSVPLHRNLSNRSSRSLMGAPVWLKGFTWLKPFFDSTTENPSGRMHEDAANVVDPEHGTARHSEDRLLPTSTPVMREVPQYRRVTTTAAVYDVQDLRDLAQRRPAGQSEDAEIFSNEEDSASDGEESSFLESSHVQSPPTSVPVEQDSSGRWSRATLGQ